MYSCIPTYIDIDRYLGLRSITQHSTQKPVLKLNLNCLWHHYCFTKTSQRKTRNAQTKKKLYYTYTYSYNVIVLYYGHRPYGHKY